MAGMSLPVPHSLYLSLNHRLRYPLRQAPSVLPRAFPLPPRLQTQLPELVNSVKFLFSSKPVLVTNNSIFVSELMFESSCKPSMLIRNYSRFISKAILYSSHKPLMLMRKYSLVMSQLRLDRHWLAGFRTLSECASPKLEFRVNDEYINKVCEIIDKESNSDIIMEELFDDSGVVPTQSLVISVLNRYQNVHRDSYRFFKWAGTVPGFTHDVVTYGKMLEILANTRQFETMVQFLEEMGNLGFLSMESLKIAVQSFASARERKKCLWVFQLMNRFGFGVNLENFNCLLNHLAEKKLIEEAHNLFDKMSDQYKHNLETYKILLYGWCKVKNLVKASRVWNEIFEMGFEPDLITYNIMINGLIYAQRTSEAMKLFEFMKSNGPNPKLCTYSIIIGDLCKRKNMDLAIRVFEEMRESGFEPDYNRI